MIQLSRRGAALYQMLSLVVALLLLYAVGFLLSALLELPGNPLIGRVDAGIIRRFEAAAFTTLLLTGMVSGGMAMGALKLADAHWGLLPRVWLGLVALHVAVSVILPGAMSDVMAAAALLFLLWHSLARGDKSSFTRVWQLSSLLLSLSLLAGHLVEADAKLAFEVFERQVAGGMGALSLAFWLLTRLGDVDGVWADDGLRIVAALLCLAGGLSSIAALGLPSPISIAGVAQILLAYMILAAHLARGLRWRRDEGTLAGQWLGLAALYWLVAGGLLGAATAQAGVNAAMRGTALAWTGDWIHGWALLSVVCALANAMACELRGEQRRVTGYAPLWLVGFGVAGAGVLGAIRGVLEIVLRDYIGIEAAAIGEMALPLTALWLVCLLTAALGVLTYALGFWARKPRIRVVDG